MRALAFHHVRRGAVIAVGVLAAGVTSAGQQPTFRSGVGLVVVDVQVVDPAGHPSLGLAPSNFDVRIDGRRRQVVAADVLRYSADGSTAAPGASLARDLLPAAEDVPGRTFVLAIDSMSLSPGDGAGVVRAARAFIDQLTPNDLVGVAVLPRGASLVPTRDRAAVRRALGSVVGLASLRASQFHMSTSEIIDITAESEEAAGVGRGTTLTGQVVLQGVQARECSGGNQACRQGLIIEAAAELQQMEADLLEHLDGLHNLLALLAQYPGRKMVILISAGMPVNDRAGGWQQDGEAVRELGRAAALSSATVYAIHIDAGSRTANSPEWRSPRSMASIMRDRAVQQRVLGDFAWASGGALLAAPTDSGEVGFARVLRETSTFYRLAIVPDAKDLDGRPHELRVSISNRGLMLRAPRFVVLRRGN